MIETKEIVYGSVIRLKHTQTGKYLRSFYRQLAHPKSSRQQMVVASADPSPDTYWCVLPANGVIPNADTPIRNGTVITLRHWSTGKKLHSHGNVPAPVTNSQQEITCFYDENGNGDDNDNWRLELKERDKWATNLNFRLIHVSTNVALHSHHYSHPDFTAGQQEITGFIDRNADDLWTVDELIFPVPSPAEIKSYLSASREHLATINSTVEQLQKAATDAAVKVSDNLKQTQIVSDLAKEKLQRAEEAEIEIKKCLENARKSSDEAIAHNTSAASATTSAQEFRSQAGVALESIRNLVNTSNESSSRIEAIKTGAEQAQSVIAEKNMHIEQGRRHVDDARSSIDNLLNAAKQASNSIDSEVVATKTRVEAMNTLMSETQRLKSLVESNSEAIKNMRATVEGHSNTTKKLAAISMETEQKIEEYERKLAELYDIAQQRSKMIVDLLPGATTTGLAFAFNQRSESFKLPRNLWHALFFISICGLLGFAIYEAYHFSVAKAPDWQELLRILLYRTPFLVPLIWLAIYSSKQATLAKRMEEEYAFKATVSMSFEGYRKQMAEIGKEGLSIDSPLAQLCVNTLRTIASPPGRVYDGQRMDPTPGTAAAEIVTPVVEGVSKALSTKFPDLGSKS